MYYIVSNGEDISKLCPILLVFYNNKICFKENILLFGVWCVVILATYIY
jgi:hypothetical protein